MKNRLTNIYNIADTRKGLYNIFQGQKDWFVWSWPVAVL